MHKRLDEIFGGAVEAKRVPALAAIVLDKNGKERYKGTFGQLNSDDPSSPPLTPSTVMKIFSMTKVVTCVAALQLIEQGKIGLDDPVEQYVAAIGELGVLEGFTEDGEPITRPSKSKPTIRQLMTHTAGFAYDLWDRDVRQMKLNRAKKQGHVDYPPATSREDYYVHPLSFDPGTAYAYGVNIDWLGFVVEEVTGMALDDYFRDHIFQPLGMQKTGSHVEPELYIHAPTDDGKVTAIGPPGKDPSLGGHSLSSTLDDYSAFLLMLLNEGTHPTTAVQILKPETVREYMFKNHSGPILGEEDWTTAGKGARIGHLSSAHPTFSNHGEFFPGIEKSWSCGFMLVEEAVPGGRSQGSGSWAGLGNLYYWIDPRAGRLGLIMTCILPFMNPDVLELFQTLEQAVYEQ